MKYPGKLFIILFIFHSFSLCSQEAPQNQPVKKRTYHVRVLLQEKNIHEKTDWQIGSEYGFTVVNPTSKKKMAIEGRELDVAYKKKFFEVNGVVFDSQTLYILPVQGNLKFDGKEYHGSLLVTRQAQTLYLINSLDLEEYVCSVLRTESWPGWPLEVNKAFAIASRSYVIGVVLNNKNSTLPYHVKNTNKHQTYSGVHTDPVLKEAVEQTRGIFLSHEGKPIVAMFDSCCGGVTPFDIHGVNFLHAPYLARKMPCTFCKDCKMYNWSASYPLEQFEQMVKKEYKNLKKIKQVSVAKTDKAGLVQQVHIKSQHKLISLPGKKVYSMLAKVRSFCFDVCVNADKVIFSGRGIGHHLGLCQWGAREMVRQGYSYKSVLNFYYPDTSFMRLT